jgi:hypothetical protein
MAANTKFSGGTGLPASRRNRANWPACVIASGKGPCRSVAEVTPRSSVPRSRCRPTSSSVSRKCATADARSGNRGGERPQTFSGLRLSEARETVQGWPPFRSKAAGPIRAYARVDRAVGPARVLLQPLPTRIPNAWSPFSPRGAIPSRQARSSTGENKRPPSSGWAPPNLGPRPSPVSTNRSR